MSNKVPTTGQFGTTSPTDTYPVFEDVDGLGGWRVVADANAMNAIPSERRKEGMEVKLSSTGKIYELKNGQFVLKSAEISSGAVQSVNGKTGIVNLVKSDIGLGNVDNTADANKEVLSATKLKTARTIALTGGVAGSGSFDGSSNLSITTTLRALVAADIPSLDWSKITTGKPTTVAGYGITDAVKYQTPETSAPQTIYGDIIVKGKIYSSDDIIAFSDGTGGGAAPTIPLATYATVGVVKVDPTTMTVDANGMIAVKGDLFNLSNYYDKSASDARFAALGHVHAFSELTGKPTTIAGYGITDAMTTSQINTAIATHAHSTYVKYQSAESNIPQIIYGDIIVKGKIYSSDDIVAFSDGTGGGAAPTIPLATYATVGVVKVDPSTMTVDENGMIGVKGDLFNLSNYYDKSASDARFAALGHVHAFSELTGKPTTIAGYGITDAMTTSQISTAIAQAKADIVNSSPAALDTLNELATALGNDPNFATTTATALGNRLRVDISTQGLTDAQRANGRANLGLGSAALNNAGDYMLYTGVVPGTAPAGLILNTSTTDRGIYNGSWRSGSYWGIGSGPSGAQVKIATTDINGNFIDGNVQLLLGSANNVVYHSGNLNRQDIDFVTKNLNVVGSATFNHDIKHWLRSGHASFEGGFYYDTAGDEALLLGFKNIATRIKFKMGVDLSSIGANGVTGMTDADLEIGAGIVKVGGNISSNSQTLRAADGSVKWTIQLNASNALDFYNASGVLEMRLSQAGKLQTRDDIEAFSNFN